jgi:predicted HD superfamily hydrolase involved in NAD metabolism
MMARVDRDEDPTLPDLVDIDEDIEPLLRDRISSKRLKHSVAVASLAEALAIRHGLDADGARRAGLLHDLWREDGYGCTAEATRRGIALPAWADGNPVMLHGPLAAAEAAERFGLHPVWCDAIAFHTTGRHGMTPEDLVIYLADHACAGRKGPNVAPLRELAFKDLELAACQMIDDLVMSLVEAGALLWMPSAEARNDLLVRTRL